jgi:hypothetical protein
VTEVAAAVAGGENVTIASVRDEVVSTAPASVGASGYPSVAAGAVADDSGDQPAAFCAATVQV